MFCLIVVVIIFFHIFENVSFIVHCLSHIHCFIHSWILNIRWQWSTGVVGLLNQKLNIEGPHETVSFGHWLSYIRVGVIFCMFVPDTNNKR